MESKHSIKISTRGGRILIASSTFILKEAVSILNATYNREARAYGLPKSPVNAAKVAGLFRRMILAGEPIEIYASQEIKELVKSAGAIKEGRIIKEADELPDIPITRFPAWLHQKKAFWFSKELRGAMLAMGMGTGKTKVSLDLLLNRQHEFTVVFSPKSVVRNWELEIAKHTPADYRPFHAIALTSNHSVAKKVEIAKREVKLGLARDQQIILVMNHEIAWREPMGQWLIRAGADCMIVDESHRAKAPGGKLSLFLSRLGDRIDWRLGLSGTPLAHSPLDAYAQYRILDKGIFGTSYAHFKSEYAVEGGFSGKQVVGYKNQEDLNRKFYSIAFRVTNEVLDLPDILHIQRYVQLSTKAMKYYKELDKNFYVDYEKGTISAANGLAKLLRLQQLTSGYLPNEDSEDDSLIRLDEAKQDALEDIFFDLPDNEPIVVFARFTNDLKNIRESAEKAGRAYGELSGKFDQLEDWKAGKYNVLGVQIQSGGVGVDLTRSCYTIYYSIGHSLSDYEQSLARSHRPGQTRTVRNFYLIAENTIDVRVYAALEKRKRVVDYVYEMHDEGKGYDPNEYLEGI